MKTLSYKRAKSENRTVELWEIDRKEEHLIAIKSKRLVDRKERKIAETEEVYSIETASMIYAILKVFFEQNSEKILQERNGNVQRIHITQIKVEEDNVEGTR